MATMVEVARKAKVSISTVSHVLNGTRNVEPETRKRVLAAIASTGYRQDALARALRRSQTDSIGLVVSDAGEPAFAEMVHGVEHAAVENGLTLVLANSAENADREKKAVQTLLNRRVDGLILARAAESDPALLQALEQEKPPTILLDRIFSQLPFDQVGADNRETMRQLVTHMIVSGHRRFALVAGDVRVPTLQERMGGFTDASLEGRLGLDEQLIITGTDREALAEELGNSLRTGQITAVIACSTPLAALSLRTLARAGISTPRDIAFATFDGFDNSDLFQPRVTTVRQPAFDMGAAAVHLLVERLRTPEASPRTVRLQQRIEWRESTEDYRRQPAGD
ncbi:LacI family DNA-binding transcriptional regulator [Arthrobacter sp. AZCC_0090]|uniref:LacI family DNA-binding transcriptional regulator n=1 Tax=Arthrobacter sp. AZCC_0090 TaxID=2735881 RepID=UPI00160E6C9A|nr:LacI family DNA-binding transcriptional regulator [Arthrobacter sp. AZCC_0090]MBB6403693.1 LacI family transcriptional regulator [Arthrobacter sp. AZCC_0090]